jgi:hypothetical protein
MSRREDDRKGAVPQMRLGAPDYRIPVLRTRPDAPGQ